MADKAKRNLPELFAKLTELQCLCETEICESSDGFSGVRVSLADILARRGISTVLNRRGELLECALFFDDWYIYAISRDGGWTYGLFKMREQEYDAKLGRNADGDIPGVTVSFVALRENILLDCLSEPAPQNRTLLNEEINRVVAFCGQRHNEVLKQYFISTQAQGAYLIARLYTGYIASLAREGWLPVPECYAAEYKKRGTRGRITAFIEENNSAAGRVICDHEKICLCDPQHPTEREQLAILATHTGNVSYYSFAAEVQFHARFLTWWAKIPIPIIGRSPYASAVRADMSIGDAELVGPTPYYRLGSRIVKKQYCCHKDRMHITNNEYGEIGL